MSRPSRTKSRYSLDKGLKIGPDGKEEEPEDTKSIQNGPNVYQIGSEIGRGGFGIVFQAFNSRNGDLVAVKRFPLTSIDQESLSSIESEIELMQKLNHPNIVKYIDTIRTRSYLYIVLEYMENGSLANVIKKFGFLTESLTAMYVSQILKGLKYLHEQGVLHRDIKGANILTTKDGLVKLADFGVAIKLSEAHVDDQDVAGTPYWIAPEIIEMSTPTPACDIWSVGCIIVELLTGKPPYFDLPAVAAIFRIVSDDYPPLPEGISQALRDFLFNCFQKEPVMRSSAAKLLDHPWLHNSATNNNLEKHSSLLLGNSRSSSSREAGAIAEGTAHNADAEGIVNAIKLYQKEVSPNYPTQSVDGIAMRSLKVETQSNSLSQDHYGEDTAKRQAKLSEMVDNSLLSPTVTNFASHFEKAETSAAKHDDRKDSHDSFLNRGLFRNPSDNTLIKRILSSDIQVPQLPSISPDRDNCKTPENNPLHPSVITDNSAIKRFPSSGGSVSTRKMTPKSSFKSMKAISEDSVDSWDAEFVQDIKSTSNDSTVGDASQVRQIDLTAVKKGFISGSFVNNKSEPPGRRPPNNQYLRTKSTVSMANSLENIKKGMNSSGGMLSPHQSQFVLSKYQERPEEENYDDLLETNLVEHDDFTDNFSSLDTQERASTDNIIHTRIPLQTTSLNHSASMKSQRPALEALQSMSSEDYDDLFVDENDPINPPNLANKLKQKLNNWSKELAEEEMDSFINYQFDEKDFQQDEQKDIHFRRSKEVVDILHRITPHVGNDEISEATSQIIAIIDKFPEQREHLITYHGVMPIMDMFDSKFMRSGLAATGTPTTTATFPIRFEVYGYNVLKIVNKIVEGSVRAQEQLSFVGIIPSIIQLFERSCRAPVPSPRKAYSTPSKASQNSSPQQRDNVTVNLSSPHRDSMGGDLDPLAMEAARFIHSISISSSLTLQMLISAGGLSVLTTMASFGCKISTGANSSSHRRLHSWEELLKRDEVKRILLEDEPVEEVTDENSNELLNFPHFSDRIYDSESKRYIEIFQMGMDCISRVFAAQKSRSRDFCRLFVKFGLLQHLALAFDNLMVIYKSFLQKSQQFHGHSHHFSLGSAGSGFGEHPPKLHKSYSDSSVLVNMEESPSHKRTSSGTSNISRSDSSNSMDAGGVDNCSEALYAQAIAAVFFKFSRSDAIVAETMANVEKGVISTILMTLQAPELRSHDSSMNTLLTSSPGSSMVLPATQNTSSHRRTRSGPQPAYLEIVELLLKCLKNLSMEPSALNYLEEAGTMETLVPLLNGPISEKCKVHILPCIFNMCRINKRRQEQAASLGIVPHLKKVILEGSHLRQFALPIMFDLAHGSSITRAELWKNECVTFYVDLLKENYWQTFALNSLAIWLSHETEKDSKVSNVAKLLVQPQCLSKLIEFFRTATKQTVESLHKPLVDMMTKSKELASALGLSGVFVSSLVKRLRNTKEAIVLRSLLKMLQLIHQNHPCPRQLVLDNNLYAIVLEFAQSEQQVLVCQIANRLLADFQISTLT